MYRVSIHRLAIREFKKAKSWYQNRSQVAAQRFQDALQSALVEVAEHAELHAADETGLRFWKLKRFPYLLFYCVIDVSSVHVYAVAHERRKPGYWRKRRNIP